MVIRTYLFFVGLVGTAGMIAFWITQGKKYRFDIHVIFAAAVCCGITTMAFAIFQ